MNYLSICSGIEAASVAWHELGWIPVGFSEIEPFPSAVLAHHYPTVPNFGDMTKFKEWDLGADRLALLVGGTPCQAFSVAGLRKGLDDERGNLSLTFCELANHFDPEWIVWENVPGVLSSKDNAFGCFLAGLCGESEPLVPDGKWDNAGLVSGPKRTVAWRILNAQYAGVAQRRRRVFVCAVRGSGNWACASALFPIGESLFWNSAPSRKTGEDVARCAAFSAGNSSGARSIGYVEEGTPPLRAGASGTNQVPTAICFEPRSPDGHARLIGDFAPTLNRMGGGQREPCVITETFDFQSSGPYGESSVAATLSARDYKSAKDLVAQPISFGAQMSTPQTDVDLVQTLQAKNPMAVAQPFSIMPMNSGKDYKARETDIAQPLMAGGPVGGNQGGDFLVQSMAVRRLTPVECERLQGFPDNYTNIPWRNSPESPDGPRYKALGNSMAVPVMRWIGQRIEKIQTLMESA